MMTLFLLRCNDGDNDGVLIVSVGECEGKQTIEQQGDKKEKTH